MPAQPIGSLAPALAIPSHVAMVDEVGNAAGGGAAVRARGIGGWLSHHRRWVVFLLALLLGTTLDLLTKVIAFDALKAPGDTHVVIEGWFSYTHATNKGAAFGLFQGQHTFFMVVSILAFVAVPYFVHTTPRSTRGLITALVLGLILAGVTGNFWDRVVHGHVRDFLDVHTPDSGTAHDLCEKLFGRHVWPTFNVADVFITCGALALVVFLGKDERPAAKGAETPPVPAQEAAPQP